MSNTFLNNLGRNAPLKQIRNVGVTECVKRLGFREAKLSAYFLKAWVIDEGLIEGWKMWPRLILFLNSLSKDLRIPIAQRFCSLPTYHTDSGDLYYDLARSIVSGVDEVKRSLDAIWAEVRVRKKELLEAVYPGEIVTEGVRQVVEIAVKIPDRVVNTLYDDLWKKVMENKAKKVASRKKVDERQLSLFQ